MKKFWDKIELTSFVLHILAMVLMLVDHLGFTVFIGEHWMRVIGRLSFPIFAFMLVEGFYHTVDSKKFFKHLLRMLIFAIITEIPYNLFLCNTVLAISKQNVLWTYLIGLLCMYFVHMLQKKGSPWNIFGVLIAFFAVILAELVCCDYGALGVLSIMVFYFFHERKWWCYLGQAICLIYLNYTAGSGSGYELTVFNQTLVFGTQFFAVLALPIIWLYKGKQGHHSKVFKYFCYIFYPLHLFILSFL